MTEVKAGPKVVHATSVVERSFSQKPSVVFQALSEADKVRVWMVQEKAPTSSISSVTFARAASRCSSTGWDQDRRYRAWSSPTRHASNAFRRTSGSSTASTMKRDGWIFSASLVTFELLPTGRARTSSSRIREHFLKVRTGRVIRNQGWNVLADRWRRSWQRKRSLRSASEHAESKRRPAVSCSW